MNTYLCADGQHPSSVNFRVPKSEFETSCLVYFTLMQSRKLYAWDTGPVDDRALALLCGDLLEVRVSLNYVHFADCSWPLRPSRSIVGCVSEWSQRRLLLSS